MDKKILKAAPRPIAPSEHQVVERRGGARKGTGKKKLPPEQKKVQFSVTVSPQMANRLAQEPSRAKLIERLLNEYYGVD